MTTEGEIPEWMIGAHKLGFYDLQDILEKFKLDGDESLKGMSVTSVAKEGISVYLKQYQQDLDLQKRQVYGIGRNYASFETGAASLVSQTMGRLIVELDTSEDLYRDVLTIAEACDTWIVRRLVRDPRIPYHVVRAFQSLSPDTEAGRTARDAVDIDESILAHEKWLRSRGTLNQDRLGLVSLENLDRAFDIDLTRMTQRARTIIRKDPPPGGLEFLDAKRSRRLEIQPNTNSFIATFKRITKNILEGLNWENVVVVGGSVLTTLLHTDPANDNKESVFEPDLDIYLYDLNSPDEANTKVEEIYRVWASNLPTSNRETLVVKNCRTVTFIPSYPNRGRVQIILKIAKSPTDVLSCFDLDPAACLFTGTDVLMLPRCARALETGYSTFTMHLIWGHHLSSRRSSQELRLFKYATRGFGMRFLPSYAKALEDDMSEEIIVGDERDNGKYLPKTGIKEPGLKTLKRIAFIAKDTVRRSCYHLSLDDSEWRPMTDSEFEAFAAYPDGPLYDSFKARFPSRDPGKPAIILDELDGIGQQRGTESFRGIIKSFEMWIRHCEAWRLDALGLAKLDMQSSPAFSYDSASYDGIPKYDWCQTFSPQSFANNIERYNDELFDILKEGICLKMNVPLFQGHWAGYLTRRIRRIVHGPDLQSVNRKQITMPVDISADLQQFLEGLIYGGLDDAGVSGLTSQDPLIPLHIIGEGRGVIPDLPETSTEKGNLRYWVIDNVLMWSGISRKIDEAFELLHNLFRWNELVKMNYGMDSPEAVFYIAQRFRSRLPLALGLDSAVDCDIPQVLSVRDRQSRSQLQISSVPGVLSKREKMLFQRWALRWPQYTKVPLMENFTITDGLGRETGGEYPPPDDLFWTKGDEGSNDGRGGLWIANPDDPGGMLF